MIDYTILLSLILDALNFVEDSYYVTAYQNVYAIRNALQSRGVWQGEIFYRYGERVFCYEFYHGMKVILHHRLRANPQLLGGAILQAEVNKMQVPELLDHFGLEQLNGEYAPDFLIHTPGNADYHPCVMEIKAHPNVTINEIFLDLQKLNQFIERYHYHYGFFIAVNSDEDQFSLKLIELGDRINELNCRDRITIISKANRNSEPYIINLGTNEQP